MAWLVTHEMLIFWEAVYSGTPGGSSIDILHFLYWHSCLPSTWICVQATSFLFQCSCFAAGSISASAINKILCVWPLQPHLLSWSTYINWPIFLNVLCHIIFFVWPTLYDICLELLQVCISCCCFLYILYGCTHWQSTIVLIVLTFMHRSHILYLCSLHVWCKITNLQ